MPPEVTLFLLKLVNDWAPWVALAVARPFGFTILFSAFQWGHAGTGMIHMAFAVVLALPAIGLAGGPPSTEALEMPYLLALGKEVAIGALLGFLASVPLSIAIGAGGIIDIYRGANQGEPDPSGGQSTVFASLFAVTSLWIFANIGGFWTCAAIIYSSYTVWPVNAALPPFDPGADAALMALEHILTGALMLAAPILLIMFISDVAHLVSSKFGKNINVTYMSFSSKTLLAALALPLFMLVATRALRDDYNWLNDVVPLAQKVFG
jgi:type III secretion protein T